MQKIFMTVLDMSIAAGYCAVFVVLARFFMRKLPKSYSYVLWVLVFVRLLLPVAPESSWSFHPENRVNGIEQIVENLPSDMEKEDVWQPGVGADGIVQAETGAGGVDADSKGEKEFEVGNTAFDESGLETMTGILENENESDILPENATAKTGWLLVFGIIWLAGCVILLSYGVVTNAFLEKYLQGAKMVETGVFELENLSTAFVTGIINPRIYLPAGIPQEYRLYVLEHERTHLRRGDVWVKYTTYVLTSIHWFNPLVWISYILMCRDMEMSCDEWVLRTLGMEEKKAYSTALLAIASGRKLQLGMPVAFNESDAKRRIKNVLYYRKPAFWMIVIAGSVILMLSVGLLSDPKEEKTKPAVSVESDVHVEEEAGKPAEVTGETEEVITPQFDALFLEQVELWIDVIRPHEYTGDYRWFHDFNVEESLQVIEYNDSKIIFYPRVSEDIQIVIKTMLDVMTPVPYLELEKYEDRIWLVEYEEEVYLLVQRDGICRLQKYEDMIQYKQKEVELEYIPIYPEDLKNLDVLSEKMSYGVNAVFLYRDYEKVTEINPMDFYDVVFDFTRGFWETGMIDYYFNEEKYGQFMARKMGQELSEFWAAYNIKKNPYGRIYYGFRADSVYSDIEVRGVKWIDDTKAEIYYSGGYWDGVVVMSEYEGEMIFLSHHRIYESEMTVESEHLGSSKKENEGKEHGQLGTEEYWQIFMEHNPRLKGIEVWLEDAASPIAHGVPGWFEEYVEEGIQLVYENTTARSAEVVFCQEHGKTLQEVIAKMLEIIRISDSLEEEFAYSRYLADKEHHLGEVWLIAYLDDYYVLMEWQGAYRLQEMESILDYKEKEISFVYEPLYAENFSDMELLSKKLSEAVNLILLHGEYEEAADFDPKANYEDMFNLVSEGWVESGIINYYLDEVKYYESMARKIGKSLSEVLDVYDIKLTSYNKLYRAVRGDAIYAQAKVTEAEWLNDTQVEVHYAFGWFENGYDVHYYDGVAVWEEQDGEMIFVSNRKISG